MNKVFLDGTVGNSTWRNELIPHLEKLGVAYFNPVVDDWSEEDITIEEREKQESNVHLYVITKELKGVYSIAEAVESCFKENVQTIFFVKYEGFEEHQKKSLEATRELILRNGGITGTDETWEELATFISNISNLL